MSTVNWIRLLKSGNEVSYNDLSFKEVIALATALDAWEEMLCRKRNKK